ncbi:MAG: hypothetical protein ACM3U1_08805 [Chloroflexota bacterium]
MQRLFILAFISLGVVASFLPFEIIGGRVGRGVDAGSIGIIINAFFIIAGATIVFVPSFRRPIGLNVKLFVLGLFLVNAWLLVLHCLEMSSIQFEPQAPGMHGIPAEAHLGIGYYAAWFAVVGGILSLFIDSRWKKRGINTKTLINALVRLFN